jgi:hypothetical protein
MRLKTTVLVAALGLAVLGLAWQAEALTHLNRFPLDHVILRGEYNESTLSFKFYRINGDATVEAAPFVVPANAHLVITDLDWELQNGDKWDRVSLLVVLHSPGDVEQSHVCLSTGRLDEDGYGGVSHNMKSGFVAGPGTWLTVPRFYPKIPYKCSSNILLRGYLMPPLPQ